MNRKQFLELTAGLDFGVHTGHPAVSFSHSFDLSYRHKFW